MLGFLGSVLLLNSLIVCANFIHCYIIVFNIISKGTCCFKIPLFQNKFIWARSRVANFHDFIKVATMSFKATFNTIQDGLFRGCSRIGGAKKSPLPKICHTHPTTMEFGTVIPYLEKTQIIYESRDILFELCWRQLFFIGD